jgi:NADPH-dependent 2,4-dienoyl-CoA reductase/sulfur reductase-like enzyme
VRAEGFGATPRVHADAEAHVPVVVVGAGPAGLAAAQAAAEQGARVRLVDVAARPGGQVWRARGARLAEAVHERMTRLQALGIELCAGTRVAWPLDPGRLLLDHGDRASVLRWDRLVIATGARERLLPFPGWTLPGVFGAGGLQALVKGGWPIEGRRVLVAGSGPLLLAAAATLRGEGTRIVEVAEESELATVARFGIEMLSHGSPLVTALRLKAALWDVPYRPGWRVVEVVRPGDPEHGSALRVTLAHASGRTRTIACDALAAGWGLVPQVELAEALGCRLVDVRGARAVDVDASQRTSVDGIFAAGEPTGIAGRDAALASGALAGRAAARSLVGGDGSATALPERDRETARDRRTLQRAHRFADLVAHRVPPPAGLATRLRDDTLVCRCEDVRWAEVRDCGDVRSAKLATRCGMGHCQGRLCHEALRVLGVPSQAGSSTGGEAASRPVRAPLSPMPLSHLLAVQATPPEDASAATTVPHQDLA